MNLFLHRPGVPSYLERSCSESIGINITNVGVAVTGIFPKRVTRRGRLAGIAGNVLYVHPTNSDSSAWFLTTSMIKRAAACTDRGRSIETSAVRSVIATVIL